MIIKTYHQSLLVKVFLVFNILLGIAVGSFFSWEVSVNCGDILIGVLISGFLFAAINLFILIQNGIFTRGTGVFLLLLTLAIIVFPLVSIEPVDRTSLCGYQFCIDENVNNQDYMEQFQSDYTSRKSSFCRNMTADNIANAIEIFFNASRFKISSTDIYGISEGLTITALAAQSFFAFIQFIMLSVTVCQTRKPRGEVLLA